MSDVMDRTGQAHRRRDTMSDHLDVIQAIERRVADNLNLLARLGKAWQPSDYLPDLESANWRHEVEGFRKAAEAVSDQLLVVLVGDMVTEEALPSYSVSQNGLVADSRHRSRSLGRWLRGWTAEENHTECEHVRQAAQSELPDGGIVDVAKPESVIQTGGSGIPTTSRRSARS